MANILRNNRLHSRRKLFYYLEVVDLDTGSSVARLVDIHVAGMLLIGSHPFASGVEHNLRILIGENLLETLSGKLDVKVQVKWSKHDINPDYFVTGVEFVKTSPDQEEMIEKLIKTIGFKE